MSSSSQIYGRAQARSEALAFHFELGLSAYDSGDVSGVLRHLSALGLLPEGGSECAEFLALRWRALWLQGERDEALEVAQRAARWNPNDPDAAIELAEILVEFGALDQAVEVLLEAAERHGHDPELWYEAGLILEQLGQSKLRRQCWEKVWQLEHDTQPNFQMWLTEGHFVDAARQAIDDLPDHVLEALGNVVIFVEDYPERWIFETEVGDPRLLGLFDGVGWAAERGCEVLQEGPSRIYLYRWNIERMCTSAEEVQQQVAITVQHEIGHYLGLDEDELHARGLG